MPLKLPLAHCTSKPNPANTPKTQHPTLLGLAVFVVLHMENLLTIYLCKLIPSLHNIHENIISEELS